MQKAAEQAIAAAAIKAGLAENLIMSLSEGDNLTLPRPRLEYAFLPASYRRTGRRLAIIRDKAAQTTKKELYEARLEATAQVYAEDAAWLVNFEKEFIKALPRGVNDSDGNWIKILVQKATFGSQPAKRVGSKEIKVFSKVDTLFALTFTGRVTEELVQQLITDIDIKAPHYGAKE